jgi:hypothetical protein
MSIATWFLRSALPAAAFAALFLAFTTSPLEAREKGEPGPKPDRALALRKWKDLSPEKRKAVIEQYKKWKSLSPKEREQIRKNYARLRTLRGKGSRPDRPSRPAPETGTFKDHYRKWSSLPTNKKRDLLALHTAFRSLPQARQEKLRKLPPHMRAKVLRECMEDRRLNGMVRQFTTHEKGRLDKKKGKERRDEIRSILQARRREQSARVPEAVQQRLKGLPPAEARKAWQRALGEVSLRDQKVLSLLSSRDRKTYRNLPISRRDRWVEEKMEKHWPEILRRLPSRIREALTKVPAGHRARKAADFLFQKKMEALIARLLPHQRGEVKRLPPAKKLERIQQILRRNQKKFIEGLPRKVRERLSALPRKEVRKAAAKYLESQIPSQMWKSFSRHDRRLFQRMPLLERLNAVKRLRKALKARKKSSGSSF